MQLCAYSEEDKEGGGGRVHIQIAGNNVFKIVPLRIPSTVHHFYLRFFFVSFHTKTHKLSNNNLRVGASHRSLNPTIPL